MFELLQEVKLYLDKQYNPQGYNIGWNVGAVGGQDIFHAHLHIIPRYIGDLFAGKGIRCLLKQPQNKKIFEMGVKDNMNNPMGIFGAANSIAFIEPIFRILAYIAFISVCYRAVQALNIYINKNSR